MLISTKELRHHFKENVRLRHFSVIIWHETTKKKKNFLLTEFNDSFSYQLLLNTRLIHKVMNYVTFMLDVEKGFYRSYNEILCDFYDTRNGYDINLFFPIRWKN